jgi:hypothetical protein
MTRPSPPLRHAALALLAVSLIGGCASKNADGSATGPTTRSATPAAGTVYVQTSCSFTAVNGLVPSDPAHLPTPTSTLPGSGPGRDAGGAIPAGFAVASVMGCTFDEEAVPGDGTWRVAKQTKADSGLDELVAAYRTPPPASPPPGGSYSCTMELDMDPVIAFVGADGTAIWPAPPRDPVCHHITPRVRNALNALHWTVTKSQRIQRDVSGGGCASGYKDMLSIDPLPKSMLAPPTGPYFASTPKRLALCVFAVDPAGEAGRGIVLEGKLDHEIDLTDAALAKAVRLFDAAPAADASCTAQPTRFAVLLADGAPQGYLELDGCQRLGDTEAVDHHNGGMRQLSAADVAELTAAT